MFASFSDARLEAMECVNNSKIILSKDEADELAAYTARLMFGDTLAFEAEKERKINASSLRIKTIYQKTFVRPYKF
jgi:hypothetical protein